MKAISPLTGLGLVSIFKLNKYFDLEHKCKLIYREIYSKLSVTDNQTEMIVFQILKKRLNRYTKPHQNKYDRLYFLFAQNIIKFNKSSIINDDYTCLIQEVDQIDFNDCSVQFFIAIEYLAIANAMYYLGFVVRSKIVKQLLGNRYNGILPDQANKKLAALIEAGDISQAEKQINRFSKNRIRTRRNSQLRLFFYIMAGDRERAVQEASKYYSSQDYKFAQYVKGKRIAIVGPAPTGELLGDEIDQFDVIIRINYRGKTKLPPASEYGSNVHVSYYSNTNSKEVLYGKDNSYLDDLKFVVARNRFAAIRSQNQLSSTNFRTMFTPNQFYVTGKAQMLQNILFDLMHFEPLEIKIFKSNFYMSEKRYYDSYYPDRRIYFGPNIWTDHAFHDLASQHIFSKAIMKNNPIYSDSSTTAVLDLSTDCYISRIQDIYANHLINCFENIK